MSEHEDPRWQLRRVARLSLQQERLHGDSERVQAWGRAHPEVFAGTWFDDAEAEQGRGPVVLAVGVTADADDEAVHQLRGSLDHPEVLRVVTRQYTVTQLETLRQDVVRRWMPQRRETGGTFVSSIGVDIVSNQVHVTLSEVDEAFAERLRAEYRGQPLVITQGVRIVPVDGSAP